MMRIVLLALALAFAAPAHAQEEGSSAVSRQDLYRATVLDASASSESVIPGTNVSAERQTVTVLIESGAERGRTITFENDFAQVEAGDKLYVRHTHGGFDLETWAVADPYRLDTLLLLALAFLATVLFLGGRPGIRGLAALAGSLALIFYALVPGIYAGYSPILVSLGVASVIVVLGSYVTHGFNRTTTSAMLGMLATVLVTGALAYVVIQLSSLTGFSSEETAYLNFAVEGRIDLIGLLFGGILIGLLGVLYDSAIGQAVAVEELYRAGEKYDRRTVFVRGLRIGREHVGALVNTLAIAYAGASLPLFLLLSESTADPLYLLNSEPFATEIIRILVSSIGVVLAVPITTVIAVLMLARLKIQESSLKTSGHHHF